MVLRPSIAVIGSLNIDFVTVTPRVPGPGETLTATSLSVNAGGKGANQAVACGKAAFKSREEQDVAVNMIGAVGAKDPYYTSLLKPTLEKSGVNTSSITEIEDCQTGTATILVEETGENRILIVPGANYFGFGGLQKTIQTAERNGVPDVVVMQGEIPRELVLELLEHFNSSSSKTQVVFNPAPVFPSGLPPKALQGLAVLVVNETECLQLAESMQDVGMKLEEVKQDTELELEYLKSIASEFRSKVGIKTVIITLGSRGVFFSSVFGTELVQGVKVSKVVDTTAAGDTFVGYFATALARYLANNESDKEFDITTAVSTANAAAAKCVQKAGAMQSIPFGYEF